MSTTDRKPSHPGLIAVEHGTTGAYASRAVSMQTLPPGTTVTKITGSTVARNRAYTTVQASETTDIELNSDLVFCNHSCSPSIVFDMTKMEVRVADERPLRRGEGLTFFYPSTEWDMSQPFECNCGESECIGVVRGAKHLDAQVLKRYWLNEHIKQLLAERK